MYKNLYIIGNGFDKYHGLKTGYGDFKEWLRVRRVNFYNHCILLYGDNEDDWWSQFENHLADIRMNDYVSFLKKNTKSDIKRIYSKLYDGIVDEISFLDKETDDSLSPIELKVLVKYDLRRFIPQIVDFMRTFLNEVPYPAPSNLPLTVDNESFYFTFNYTTILENVYEIPESNVCHIHGNIDRWAEIILGHNKTIMEIISQSNEDTYVDKDTLELIAKHKKNIEGQIELNSKIFGQLHNIENLIVIGYSYSIIDNPYLEHILNNIKQPLKGVVSTYHTVNDYKNAILFFETRGLSEDKLYLKYLNKIPTIQ